MNDLEDLLNEISKEFPSFRIVPKSESTLMKICNVLLLILTFGQNKTFMTKFTTTIGTTIYISVEWNDRSEISRIITLRHERVHMRQAKKYGVFWFGLLYFLVLPFGFAFYRVKFEMEAYEETMRATADLLSKTMLKDAKFRDKMISHFTGPSYFWMWLGKKRIENWYDDTSESILY